MTAIQPRSVIHRGTVRASGFFLSFKTVSQDEAAARILANWQPQARVYRFNDGLLFLLPKTSVVSADQTIGLPLVLEKGRLTAAPLTEKESESLFLSRESFVLSAGGLLLTKSFNDAIPEPLHQWIDTSQWKFLPGDSLGAPAALPVVTSARAPLDIRQTLGRIPVPSSQAAQLLARLKGERPSGQTSFLTRTRAAFSNLLRRLGAGFARTSAATRPSAAAQSAVRKAPRAPTKIALWFNRALAQLAMLSQLSRALGWRQSRYLNRVMELFESGDLQEALRHAIPLSSVTDSEILKVSFGVPNPRENLNVNPVKAPASAGISLGLSLHGRLNHMYRAAFKRLESQGRIEEAAFILAELLQVDAEAVNFLEKHARFRQAAEIAEGRKLAPENVVRLWFLAGEKERAIQVARRTGAFAGAVSRLEMSRHPAASELRQFWAEFTAQAGHPAAAVDILWPLVAQRPQAVKWMQAAVEIGGRPGAKCLARLLALAAKNREPALFLNSAQFAEAQQRALELLRDESIENAPVRIDFAETLYAQPSSPQTQAMARLAIRSTLRDLGLGFPALQQTGLRKLVDYSADAALRADLPKSPPQPKTTLADSAKHKQYFVPATERGATRISEAALLPNGTCALALGEVGIRLLTRDGRTITHFNEPADRLVVSENGAKIIALARRGDAWRLSRIDMQSRRISRWCDAQIDRFVSSFDGATWYVVCPEGNSRNLYAIDAAAKGFEALEHVTDLGFFGGPLRLLPNSLEFATLADRHFWVWSYALPQVRLKEKFMLEFRRGPVKLLSVAPCGQKGILDCTTLVTDPPNEGMSPPTRIPSEASRPQSFTPGGRVAILDRLALVGNPPDEDVPPPKSVLIRHEAQSPEEILTLAADERVLGDPTVSGDWIALCIGSPINTRVLIYHAAANPLLRLEITLEGQGKPQVRIDPPLLTIADDLGRVLAYELTYGQQVRAFNI